MYSNISLKFPKFKRYGLITSESLNILNNNFLEYLKSNYSNSSEGIITGFDIKLKDRKISIQKGLIKLNSVIYFLNEGIEYDLPENEGRYYFIVYTEEVENEFYNIINLKFKFIHQQEYNNEFILFSLILRDGANINPENIVFDEYRDEYNTIDIIEQKYSVMNSTYSTLSPVITKKIAYILSKKYDLKNEDINFIFFCLNSIVSKELLISYINFKLDIKLSLDVSNKEIVKHLSSIINSFNFDSNKVQKEEKNEKFFIN